MLHASLFVPHAPVSLQRWMQLAIGDILFARRAVLLVRAAMSCRAIIQGVVDEGSLVSALLTSASLLLAQDSRCVQTWEAKMMHLIPGWAGTQYAVSLLSAPIEASVVRLGKRTLASAEFHGSTSHIHCTVSDKVGRWHWYLVYRETHTDSVLSNWCPTGASDRSTLSTLLRLS